jgi:hypothetical protein
MTSTCDTEVIIKNGPDTGSSSVVDHTFDDTFDGDADQNMFNTLLNDPDLFKDPVDTLGDGSELTPIFPNQHDLAFDIFTNLATTVVAIDASPPLTVAPPRTVHLKDPFRKRKRPNLGRVGVLIGKLMREVNKVDDPTTMLQFVNVLSQSMSSSISGPAYTLLTSSLDSLDPTSLVPAAKSNKLKSSSAKSNTGCSTKRTKSSSYRHGDDVRPLKKTRVEAPSPSPPLDTSRASEPDFLSSLGATFTGLDPALPTRDGFKADSVGDLSSTVTDMSVYATVLASITSDDGSDYGFDPSNTFWDSIRNAEQKPRDLPSLNTAVEKSKKSSAKVAFSDAQTEVFQRLHGGKTRKVDLIVRKCREMFGNEWISLDQIDRVASSVGYFKSDKTRIGKISLLITSKIGRNRSTSCSPWGTHFPYWTRRVDMNGDIRFQLSPEFME